MQKFRPQQFRFSPKTKLLPHPESEKFPETAPTIEALIVEDMKQNGYDHRFPVILTPDGKQIVAGRCRYKCAQAANVEFTAVKLQASEDIVAFAAREQEHRKHLTAQFLAERRATRIAEIAEARRQGQSTRAIAEAKGISQPQVRRDLEKAGETGVSPEEETVVIGKDKKKYKSKRPKKKQTLRESIDDANVKESEAQAEETTADKIKGANNRIEAFISQLMAFVDETMPDDPWLDYQGRKKSAIKQIKDACETLRTCKCKKECPQCKGEGCKECLKTGRMPKFKFDVTV